MQVHSSKIIGDIKIISPKPFYDFRGEFVETYNKEKYDLVNTEGKRIEFLEDDISLSRKDVLHGLHGDDKTYKLIQCLYGEVFFVIVDMRKYSQTYLQHETFLLSDRNRLQVLVPAGCANGHLCLSEKSIFSYKQSEYYSSHKNQFSVKWNDPKLNIFWPIATPILSQRDSSASLIQ